MSSKVLVGDKAVPTQPVAWRQVVGDGLEPAAEAPRIDWEKRLREAREAAEQRCAEARTAGHRDGQAEGRAQAAAELRQALERAARSIAEIAGLRDRLRREAEADLVRLALAIARRILHRELAVDPEAMRGIVRAALDRLKSQEIGRVRVHPSGAGPLGEALAACAAGQPPEVVADPALDRGALVFETTRGDLDASVESQLQEIERGLVDRLRRNA